jgi:hypothetical protein
MVGSRITTIGYPMLVLYLTRSPIYAGWAAFAATAPSILVYMPAGALVDRWDPRLAMLLSEMGRGLAIAWVVVIVWLGKPSVALIIMAAIIEEILEVFSTLAERRYVRALVGRDKALAAQVRIEARTHLVVLIGRPLGGLLFEIRPIVPFLVDVATFVVSVVTLFHIKGGQTAEEGNFASRTRSRLKKVHFDQPPDWQLSNDIRQGLRWLRHDTFARTAVALSASTTLICQATIMAFLAMAFSRGLSSFAIGMVLAASGLGGAAGSFVAARLPTPANRPWIQTQMWWWAAAFVVLVFSGGESPLWTGLVMGVLGFTGAMGNIEVSTYLIQHVAQNMLARVTSIGRLMSFSACAIGPMVGGFLFQKYGARHTGYWLLATTSLLALYSWRTSAMRTRSGISRDHAVDPVPGNSVHAVGHSMHG